MGGGLMQLVAYGAQDIYLTGNPQITFFKVVYRRHTNFSMENIQQTFNGNPTWGQRATAIVSRNGDLINSAYLHVSLPSLTNDMWTHNPHLSPSNSDGHVDNLELCWTNFVGLALIEHVTVEIGGQEIDKHYGLWMYAWQELTMTSEKVDGYKAMVGGTDNTPYLLIGNAVLPNELHIPLDFWFNINAGLSLPLIALQYHEVRFLFQFRQLSYLVVLIDKNSGFLEARSNWSLKNGVNVPVQIDLFIDYIYLDTDERRRFAQMSHEYLIEQVQEFDTSLTIGSGNKPVRLSFNHPCKELVWMLQRQDCIQDNDWFNFANGQAGKEKIAPVLLTSAGLTLNGHQRFTPARGPLFFRQWQPFIHHTNIPNSNLYIYSFALRPEEHQPSGTCNFSRIDNTILDITLDSAAPVSPVLGETGDLLKGESALLTVFARNYNVLRIMSGMGGLAYSN